MTLYKFCGSVQSGRYGDCIKILTYWLRAGVLAAPETIEAVYSEYCEDSHAASWMEVNQIMADAALEYAMDPINGFDVDMLK